MPVKSYGFAVGNLRARENTLLRQNDFAQLAALKSTDALAASLRDKGFGDRAANEDVPQLLKHSAEQLWNYLNEISPDEGIFLPFLLENDFHNLKAVLKALVRDTDADEYLLTPAPCDPAALENAVREKQFDLLPDYMCKAAPRAYDVLLAGGDPQLCDAVLDCACMNAQLALVTAKGFRCSLAREIIETSVLMNNIKVALRCARAQMSGAFLDEALADTSYPNKAALKAAALGGTEHLLELLEGCGGDRAAAAEAFKRSPADFERFADDAVMAKARKARLCTLGAEPVIGYYMARSAELKNLRIVYSGIKTGQPEEKIMGRLRALYD